MVDRDTAPATIEAARQLADANHALVELRLSRHPGVSLVRPDGYVACSGQGRDGIATLASASALLRQQTA